MGTELILSPVGVTFCRGVQSPEHESLLCKFMGTELILSPVGVTFCRGVQSPEHESLVKGTCRLEDQR